MVCDRLIVIVLLLFSGSTSSLDGTTLNNDVQVDGTDTTGLHQAASGQNSTTLIEGDKEAIDVMLNDSNNIDFVVDIATTVMDSGTAQKSIVMSQEEKNHVSEASANDTASVPMEESFLNGFLSSLGMLLTSEMLDKTFFIAMVLAMKHSRCVVFLGAWSALVLMTIIAATVGLVTKLIPRWIVIYSSSALMLAFGVKMCFDAYRMESQRGQEEYEEVTKEIELREMGVNDAETAIDDNTTVPTTVEPSAFRTFLKVFSESFLLTFLAEWGDRSQMATVALAATDNLWGVIAGGIFGHAICTGGAVLGGRFISSHVTVRIVTVLGAIVFIVFAILTVVLHNFKSA